MYIDANSSETLSQHANYYSCFFHQHVLEEIVYFINTHQCAYVFEQIC